MSEDPSYIKQSKFKHSAHFSDDSDRDAHWESLPPNQNVNNRRLKREDEGDDDDDREMTYNLDSRENYNDEMNNFKNNRYADDDGDDDDDEDDDDNYNED